MRVSVDGFHVNYANECGRQKNCLDKSNLLFAYIVNYYTRKCSRDNSKTHNVSPLRFFSALRNFLMEENGTNYQSYLCEHSITIVFNMRNALRNVIV